MEESEESLPAVKYTYDQEDKSLDTIVREKLFSLQDFTTKFVEQQKEEGKSTLWNKPLWYLSQQTKEKIADILINIDETLENRYKIFLKKFGITKQQKDNAKYLKDLYIKKINNITKEIPFSITKNLINRYLSQYKLTFVDFSNNFLAQYSKEPQSVKETEDTRLFFISLLPVFRSGNYTLLVDEFNKKISEGGAQADLYNRIITEIDNIDLLRKLVTKFLDNFYDPVNVKPLSEVYEKFQTDIRASRERRILPIVEQIHTVKHQFKQPDLNPQLLTILNSPITEDIKETGKKELSEALRSISDSSTYSLNSDFISDAIKSIVSVSSDVKEFADTLGKLIIYIRYRVKDINNEIFVKRIQFGYYRADVLVSLSAEEKLPEIYLNEFMSEEIKNDVAEVYDKLLKQYIRSFAELVYKYLNAGVRYSYIEPNITYTFERDVQKKSCANYNIKINNGPFAGNNIQDASVDYLVSYNEQGALYCFKFDLLDSYIKDSLRNGETPMNPYTMNPFTEEFVQTYSESHFRLKNLLKHK